jgi:hypothetical protein
VSNENDKNEKQAIKVYDSVLDPALSMKLFEAFITALQSGNCIYKTNYSWDEDIVGVSNPVLVTMVSDEIAKLVFDSLIQKGIIDTADNLVCLNYIWTHGSYIPIHTDSGHEFSMTIYLNPEWIVDWGGLFLYEDTDGTYRAIVPKFNTAVLNSEATPHTVTLVANNSPPRVTLQLFKLRAQK